MFYRATVVDNNDEKNAGRLKIRVHPIHDGIDEEHLPWAILADSTFSNDGIGSSNIPQVGTIVWVFFERDDFRFPVVFAGSPAIQNNTPDLPRASYSVDNDISNTISQNKKTGVSTASKGSWDEPDYKANPTYPENHVIRTKHHIIELDDTTGETRVHIYHGSGSRIEIDNEGNVLQHSKDSIIVTDGDEKHLVSGNILLTITADGDILINGNLMIKVDGNVTLESGGNVTANIGGNAEVTASNVTVTGSGGVTVSGATINLN